MKNRERFNISLDEDNEWFNSFSKKSKLVNLLLSREFQVEVSHKDQDVVNAYKMIKAQRMIKENT